MKISSLRSGIERGLELVGCPGYIRVRIIKDLAGGCYHVLGDNESERDIQGEDGKGGEVLINLGVSEFCCLIGVIKNKQVELNLNGGNKES